MPIYEYQCKKCGQFETMQRITDQPLKRCPTCRGKVTKLISSTSFQLKGSGWYVTDYGRKGGEGKKAATETKSDTPSTGTETKATESKSTKSEAKTTKPEAAAA